MRKTHFSFLAFLGAILLLLCSCSKKYEYPFQNPELTPEQRAEDLVSRLTLDEKVLQMLNDAPAIEHLGIPSYEWWNECLHGVGRTEYKVTVFPQAIGMAAGWDKEGMKIMADYTAEEGRAVYNLSSAKDDRSRYHGLTYWTPNINIFRDPRWGRGQETYGEDPYLTGILGKYFVEGLQGNDPNYLKAAACAKHYAVHSGPEHNRHEFNVSVSSYDLWDTYLPAFRDLVVDAKVAGVMCAYNAFQGQPCCGSDVLMLDILRNQWGFAGYVTSDCGAIDDFYKHHKTHPDAASAAADAVFHGTDIDCGKETYKALVDAVKQGLITEEQIDVSVKRLFAIRFRLGLFDPAEKVPYSKIGASALEKASHKEHALKMARQSIVLLKNENNLLPLSKEIKKIVILGPNADNEEVLLGNYNGFPTKITTVLDGIKEKLGESAEIYYDSLMNHTSFFPESVESVLKNSADADVILFCGGISPTIEGEEMPDADLKGFYKGDRTTIALPEAQTEVLRKLKATGKPVVFVLMSGSAVGIEWEAMNIPAVISAWYGGESAGTAIADILFGDYNPSGRLPVTFYANDKDLPDFENYDMQNRTYRYFSGKPLFPFGHGLSYTTFEYSWKTKPADSFKPNDIITGSVVVKNAGKLQGDEVTQVYIQYPESKIKLPLKELREFERLSVSPDENEEWTFSIPVDKLKKWDEETKQLIVPIGKYNLFVGGSSVDMALTLEFNVE